MERVHIRTVASCEASTSVGVEQVASEELEFRVVDLESLREDVTVVRCRWFMYWLELATTLWGVIGDGRVGKEQFTDLLVVVGDGPAHLDVLLDTNHDQAMRTPCTKIPTHQPRAQVRK